MLAQSVYRRLVVSFVLLSLLLTNSVALAMPAVQGPVTPATEMKEPADDPRLGDTKEGGQPVPATLPSPLGGKPSGVLTVPPVPLGCALVSTTAFSASPALAIVDVASVSTNILVSGAGPYLWDLDLTTFLRHTFPADLDITLTSPAGTLVTLTTDNGAGNDDVFNGTLWDDGAGIPVTDWIFANLTVAGPVTPEGAFGAFVGENPNGTWTITITDDLAGDVGTLDSWSLNVTTLAQAPLTSVTSLTNSVPLAIADVATVSNAIVVAGLSGVITDLNLTTFIQHTFAADIDITLTSPAGTVVTLSTDNGAGNDNVFNGTLWDDSAGTPVTDKAYTNLVTATPLVVEEALAAFNGEDPNGTWTITITDDLAGDTGTLDQWTLQISTGGCNPIFGWAFLDANRDGFRQDAEQPGVAGMWVTLTKDGAPVATTKTVGPDGYYDFGIRAAGNYCVAIQVADPYVSTSPTQLCFTVGGVSLAAPGATKGRAPKSATPGTPEQPALAVDGATSVLGTTLVFNFGLRLSEATIGDFVWFDMNANGSQDLGEPGIPGVTVALWSSVGGAPGAIVANAVTGPDGKYAFSPIVAGSYFVQVTDAAQMLAGLVLSSGPQSKPNPFGPITVQDGDVYLDADFGYNFPCAPGRGVIAGRVWHDANGNGAADPTEAGIPGIQVGAEPLSYLAIRAAATNPLGIYMICVPAGTYLVAPLNPPAGMGPEQQHRLPVIVQPGAWLTDINFGYR